MSLANLVLRRAQRSRADSRLGGDPRWTSPPPLRGDLDVLVLICFVLVCSVFYCNCYLLLFCLKAGLDKGKEQKMPVIYMFAFA